ncbi:STAS/SEC14 domain-containing protein [Sphingomonas sp. BK235]|jgi:hypothetical protein|uniref:STAS/SEC14 domain-containing protein n=1 Tax=Sphingomonas sp. BK235 TaxID=2512131 RepID=UPI00104D8306|nr:STAS/SEC14 domain-containing protein [Sphingomonas sp. BK235]TCP33726.1 hypothetical protein EV292_105177 [Sphingomonas sp. BK235]
MYTARFHHDHQLLDIAWHRLFTPAEVAAYTHDITARFLAEKFRPGYRLLIDMAGCGGPQPQETLAAFRDNMRLFPKASRIAIVATGAVQRRQVTRVMTQPYLRLFDHAAAARAWLTGAAD